MSAAELQSVYGNLPDRQDKRRLEDDNTRKLEIKNLWEVHHEIINLNSLGFKGTQIAKILNISPQTVSNTLNSMIGKEKVEELREIRDGDIKERLETIRVLTDKALKTYHEIFDSPNATIDQKKDTADTIVMELSGLRVPTRIQSTNVHAVLSSEELAEFKRRGIETMRASGNIADVKED